MIGNMKKFIIYFLILAFVVPFGFILIDKALGGNTVCLILGFIFLIKGADFLVEGSSKLAKIFHIPEIVIGLTIISIGTSMPELFVSITSALDRIPRYGYTVMYLEVMHVTYY